MYDYRKMPPEEREQVLNARRERGFPLHAPPHLRNVAGEYLITAACYEHRHIFEQPDDLSWLTSETLDALQSAGLPCPAWVFLTNHYHVLVDTEDLSVISELLRLLHSRVATAINSRQHQRGRQVWYRFSDRLIRDERHHWATVYYIHSNPVKHKYVDAAAHWPWSSLHDYIDVQGKSWLAQTWRDYPIEDYGKGWDW
ncbi:MAG: transposase [Chloroflexi bacterium]|nr:transposase [Chloroflexota bacterium]